jgi:hypothetical protein
MAVCLAKEFWQRNAEFSLVERCLDLLIHYVAPDRFQIEVDETVLTLCLFEN